jgi:hypothetical protein
MRASKIVFVLFTTLFIPTFVAAADKPPRQRAGEWQVVELGEYGLHDNDVGNACDGDRSLLAKFDTIPRCSRRVSLTKGAITTADARCQFLDSTMLYHEKILKLDDDNFYIYIHETFSPPVITYPAPLPGMHDIVWAQLISFEHLKRLGACPVGQKPFK